VNLQFIGTGWAGHKPRRSSTFWPHKGGQNHGTKTPPPAMDQAGLAHQPGEPTRGRSA